MLHLNLAGLMFLLLMAILLFILPLRIAYLPIMLSAVFMPLEQGVDILGFDFYILRIVTLLTWVVLFSRNEAHLQLNLIDKIFIWWVVYSIIAYTLLHGDIQAFKNRFGFAYNAIGLYFIFRCLIRDYSDIERAINILTFLVIFLAPIILIEQYTGKNPFSIFGHLAGYSELRNGRQRCLGAFAHPILLGTFAASYVPFSMSLWFREPPKKYLATIGFIAATFILIASGSSGPLMVYIASIIGLCIWSIRRRLKLIYFAVVSILVILHFSMKAPIWYLIARIDPVSGSHGWHRAELINQAILNFQEWWFIGTTVTAHWMPYGVLPGTPSEVDITNQFIFEGVSGGLIKLILFSTIILFCFREIGKALRVDNSLSINGTIWSLGVVLLAHMVAFISISYFDQQIIFWYFLIAIISTISDLSPTKQIYNLSYVRLRNNNHC